MMDNTTQDIDDMPDSGDPVVSRMLRNFKLSTEAESDNRERGLQALKFKAGGKDQWDSRVWDLFGQQNKPRESFNLIPQYTNHVINDMRKNMPQTRVEPGDGGDDQTATFKEDLCRAIQSSTEGEVAYDTACDSQVTSGKGYWRYITRYCDSKTKNQEIAIKWIPNPFQIYDDPNTTEQDFSDRSFLIQVEDVHMDDFNSGYDKNYDDGQLSSIGDNAPSWASMSDKTVRIAEYWERKTVKRKIYFDENGDLTETETDDSRDVDDYKVMWYKCTGVEVLEKREWPGKYIPYVCITGTTLYIDGKVIYQGMVEPMIPVQTQFNYFMNNATYLTSLAPIAPFILDPLQIEGYEAQWDRANIDPAPFLPARRFVGNQDYGTPQRSNPNVDISNSLQMMQIGKQSFSDVTGVYPSSLGEQSNEKSGKAILARQSQSDTSTFHFQDNLARGLRFGGRIMDDLMPYIYDAVRKVAALKEDKTTYTATINAPYNDNGIQKHYKMTEGEYLISVTTGPSYNTKKSEAADQAIQIAQAFPAIMQTAAGPELVRTMDLVNADMIADGLERSLPPQLQTPPDLKKLPPQMQQIVMQSQGQIQQLQQQGQQMQQIIQQGAQEIQGLQSQLANKQADAQAKVIDSQAKAQDAAGQRAIDAQRIQLEREQMAQDLEFKRADVALQQRALDIEEMKLGIQQGQAESQFEQDVINTALGQAHEIDVQQAQQSHEAALNAMQHGHDQNMAMLNSALTPDPVDNSNNVEQTTE